MLWGSEEAVVNSLHQFTKKVLVTNLPIQVECKKYHNSLFKFFYPLFLKGHISPITRYALLTSSSSRHPKKFPLQFIQKDLFQHSLGCPFFVWYSKNVSLSLHFESLKRRLTSIFCLYVNCFWRFLFSDQILDSRLVLVSLLLLGKRINLFLFSIR